MQKWRRVGTPVLIALGAWVLALSTGRRLPYQLAYVLTGLLLGAWVLAWTNLRGVSFRRTSTLQRGHVGQWLEEHLSLINRWWLPKLWVEVRDFSTLPEHRISHVVPGIRGKGTYRWHVRTRLLSRGIFRLGPVRLFSSDPFGLFMFSRDIPEHREIIVYPYTAPLSFFPVRQGRFSGGTTVRRRATQVTTTVAGVREYQPGDTLNRIHWPTTARVGRLMTKEFEQDPLADVWLVLDMHAEVYTGHLWEGSADEAGWPRVPGPKGRHPLPPHGGEYAIAAAATLGRYILRRDRSLGLITYAPHRHLLPPDRGERQLYKLLETLAQCQSSGRVALDQLLLAEFTTFERYATLILITGNWTPRWVPPLLELRRRGISPVVVLVDGASFGALPSVRQVLPHLAKHGVSTFLLEKDRSLTEALHHPVVPGGELTYAVS